MKPFVFTYLGNPVAESRVAGVAESRVARVAESKVARVGECS